jgi:hypothetical protein
VRESLNTNYGFDIAGACQANRCDVGHGRNNHYVPQWYQEGFFEPGRSSLAYVDMTPDRRVLPDGRVIVQNSVWDDTSTSRAFRQRDLYSTFFGTSANDEIERRLFGDIDGRGSIAVRALMDTDEREWYQHFQTFFEFLRYSENPYAERLGLAQGAIPRAFTE